MPATGRFAVEVDGKPRPMCCAGCQSVAEAIVANGLTDYYRHRDSLPQSPREALPEALRDLGLFDHPEVQKDFVSSPAEHVREAALILEGITCSACVWLNEKHVAAQPGVLSVDINYATRRARVRWDERRTRLSAILEAIAAIGYQAHPYDANRSEEIAQKERRGALWRLFVAGFGMMQVMMYAVPVYLADDGTMTSDIEQLMRWASFILTIPVVAYSAAPFFRNALRDLRLGRVGMDVPVALGVGSAFAASAWATIIAGGEVYFDSVTMFVFFLLCGRYFEMVARQKAARGVETLARALPAFANYLPDGGGDAVRVPVAELHVGDRVMVKPGETVPADATVEDGTSNVDESLLTGESRPVDKGPGDQVIGGTINVASPLIAVVRHAGAETRLAAIQRLMERAAMERPRLVEMADRIASRFVAVLLILAAVTAVAWQFIDPARSLWVFVAVLVVSCPCALSLATPAALTVATGAMAGRGVLVTRGHAIEALARANHFVFDKTGTLTAGRPRVLETMSFRGVSVTAAGGMAAALETGSEHPIARAIDAAFPGPRPAVSRMASITGSGVAAELEGSPVRLGKPSFGSELHGEGVPAGVAAWMESGDTVVALADTAGWLAFFRIGDAPREGAARMVAALKADGKRLSILSGDGEAAVRRVARDLGIDAFSAGLSPEGKHGAIRELQERAAIVAMVGDGVNDAPVLAQAQVSIAMGEGTDLARQHADIVLLSGNLEHLAEGVAVARRAHEIVRQNLVWAFAYNISAIPLAMAGWVTPWLAGIGMSASSLLVVLNALRLQPIASRRR